MSIKVLYIEDEVFLAKIVKESLESRGFQVVLETDGARAVTSFNNHLPDVCVLDIMLPNKDGFVIAEEIRKINTSVPIIFLTAKTQTENVIQGFKTGGNDYIRKPFSIEELIVRIENALRIKKGNGTAITTETLHIGNYRFNLNRQTLQLNNEERRLSYREAELLKY